LLLPDVATEAKEREEKLAPSGGEEFVRGE
jgi:hypothetical protein